MTALVLAPGLMCDAAVWQPVLPHLQAVGADPALRPSPNIADIHIADYGACDTLPAMAQALLAQAPPQFALAGHSMGGRVALEVMRIAPQRVLGLALLDTGHLPKASGEAGERETTQRMTLLRLAQTHGVAAMARQWVQAMVAPPRLKDAAFLASIVAMFARKSANVFAAQIQALLTRPDASDVLRQVRVPTLVLCGELDSWSPPAQHQAMCDLLPAALKAEAGCAQPVVIPNAGHMVSMEDPAALAVAMKVWLKRCFMGN